MHQTWHLKPKWFEEGSPINHKSASATLKFTDSVSLGEVVEVAGIVFEFVDNENSISNSSNIPVILEGLTDVVAIEQLSEAINANLKNLVVATGDKVKKEVAVSGSGESANSITVDTTCENATWSGETLSGGSDGTPCPVVGSVVKDDTYYYLCVKEGNKGNVKWQRFQLSDY